MMHPMSTPQVIVIGGGGTGAALAYDLSLRGTRVTLLERGELTSGTTGRHHGQLHCGARYAVHDPEIARECMRESEILRRIASSAIEFNYGLFVALSDEDENYCDRFLSACEECGIPTRLLTAKQALAREPGLNPAIRLAVQVPDGSMDAWRLALHFFASAGRLGTEIRTFSEVVGIELTPGASSVRVRDYRGGGDVELQADLIINAAGAWSGRVGELAGLRIPVSPSPGTMVAVKGRLVNMVISRLHPAGDGDIIVPQRNLTIIGSTQWLTEDPDDVEIPQHDMEILVASATQMVPAFGAAGLHAAWSAARPLIGEVGETGPRGLSRNFSCLDHAESDGVEGMISILGGKATTLRGMAEQAADLACSKLGIDTPCTTAERPLALPRSYYQEQK